ncbi:MAG: bifunctional folylpolyglutamate synthase/dihydrofolate synthase [Acidimicrobiia bacterium]
MTASFSLARARAWLDSHVDYETIKGGPPRAGGTAGLSLDRMHHLTHVLGEPQHAYPVVHLTGTNGKGSTARMASALLAEAGLTVGTYTSPHLQRLNERISRNGEPIEDDALAELLQDLERFEPLVGVGNSFFELVTAAAFRWFADVAVDVAVVEVGLLGRYDATNVADGVVAVVTNVGHDHTDFQGDWRAAIAGEKSGIVKDGATLVLGETDPALLPIFYRAGAAEVWERDRDWGVEGNELAVGGRLVDLRTPAARYPDLFVPLNGTHQADNAACALVAAEALLGAPLDIEVVEAGFAAVKVPGRFEVVRRQPLVVLDGAHNVDGAGAAATTLHDDFEVAGDTILVIGLTQPRDAASMLEALDVADAALVVACQPDSPRAVPAAEVGAAAEALGTRAIVEPDVAAAVDRALRMASPQDAVLIVGSLYVVGAARDHLRP